LVSPPSRKFVQRLGVGLGLALGLGLGGLGLMEALGFSIASTPLAGWRDHPFDLANLQHATESLGWSARLWATDPMHLFGWNPHVFYNPLASLVAGAFVGLLGSGEGAYRVWLLLVLIGSAASFSALVPKGPSGRRGWAWVLGGLTAGWLSLLVYPLDAGLLDGNPVQVLYTGQWAQRIGMALGLLATERLWRALRAVDDAPSDALRPALAAAALFGACLFSHFMSGYATAVAMGLLSLLHILDRRLRGSAWSWRAISVLPAVLVVFGLLFFDFLWMFFSLNASHHGLPLLGWRVPEGALATVREVVVPGLPLVLISLGAVFSAGLKRRVALSRAGYPLIMFGLFSLASPASLIFLVPLALAAALGAAHLEGGLRARHWLPAVAFGLTWLACGPDSMRPFGLDLSGLIPFSDSVGWAKLAGFARFGLLAWFGLLVAEGFSRAFSAKSAGLTLAAALLSLTGLAVPLGLALNDDGHTGAQTFFGWMEQTDRAGQRALEQRMLDVAAQTPPDAYLLIEDSLHHPQGSGLASRHLPFGHLPYGIGPRAGRPVLGGAVTTRYCTHPLAHTSRGQLLCTDFDDLDGNSYVISRLAELGVGRILAHSPALIRALDNAPSATRIDAARGMIAFSIEGYRPILTGPEGKSIPGAQIEWLPDGVRLRLPAGADQVRIRQIFQPHLACSVIEGKGHRPCLVQAWRESPRQVRGCLEDDQQAIRLDLTWTAVRLGDDDHGPITLELRTRAPLFPFLVMVLAWLCAVGLLIWLRRRPGPPVAEA
jgi:hypothetical protein